MVLGDCGAVILYLSLCPGPSLRSALLPIFSSPGTSLRSMSSHPVSRFVSLASLDGYHDLVYYYPSTEASGSITALYIYKFLPIFSSPGTSLRSMSSHPVSRFVSLAPLDGYHDLSTEASGSITALYI